MPRYYNFGFQPHDYEANWRGYAVDPTLAAASTRQLGDVTNLSQFFEVPRRDDPFWTSRHNEKLPFFQVSEKDSPYYLHKTQQYLLEPVGLTPSRTEKQALIVAGAGAAIAYLLLSKRSPLRKALAGR